MATPQLESGVCKLHSITHYRSVLSFTSFHLADYIQNVGTGTVLDLASGMFIFFKFMSLPNFSLNLFQALGQTVRTQVLLFKF